jgi:hypothetical protein
MSDEEIKDDNQEQHQFCLRWAEWHRSRRLFAPPIPKNILARMQPSKARMPPDAILSADLSYFNLSLLAQPEGKGKLAIYYFYIHQLRPIKLVAEDMGFSAQAFYKSMRKTRGEAFRAYHKMVGAPIELTVALSDENV